VGEVNRCVILAQLSLDPRAPERSGVRLIEWAATCQASGVVLPVVHKELAARFAAEARAVGLACYEKIPTHLDGAPVLVKELTLHRSLSGLEVTGSFYPDEFSALVSLIREHERVLAEPPDLAPAERQHVVSLSFTESLVASRSLRRGAVLSEKDLKIVPDLRGLSAARRNDVIGRRLLFDLEGDEPITFGVLEPWDPDAGRSSREHADASVVIRAKNEAAWLRRSLPALGHQNHPPREVIVVDNASSDDTVAVAKSFGCRVLPISNEEFKFGIALNRGIEETSRASRWVVSLSAHCIPLHDHWLEALLAPGYDTPFTAGVYGRQEPLPDTSDFDKRDLWTTFGAEPRIQRGRDHFFHNANSLIRRDVWERFPFDEIHNGVEDRDWAKRVLQEGYRILYAPLANVHHYHGIHQGRNEDRARRVVKVIELIQQHEPAGSAER